MWKTDDAKAQAAKALLGWREDLPRIQRGTRLTANQAANVAQLVEKHGCDVHAMHRDIKVNVYQHSLGQLKKLLVTFFQAHASPDVLASHGLTKRDGELALQNLEIQNYD